jgi:hypothetical protein
MKKKEYRKAYEELAPEFARARAVIGARVTAGHPRAARMAHGHDPIRHSQAGEQADPAIHADP